MALKLGENSTLKSENKSFENIINEKKKYKIDDLRSWIGKKYSTLKQVENGSGVGVGNYFANEKELDDFLNEHMPEIVDFGSLELSAQEEWIKKTEEFLSISKLYLIANRPIAQEVMVEGEEYIV